ncbi:MAG TPA: VWA domain-containing protein [Candidatus Binatia bacterium]|jgi:Mg-chelatase subunit ChlD/CheY-like chemotaxis protein
MLWTLPSALFLLAGAIPLIVFLHSLKPRGLKVATTTLFLWERILRERPLGTRLGWLLRHNVLLLLQLLAAVALIVALADPALLHFGSSAGDLIVVIDLSASMKATGPNGSRFDAARQQFDKLIDNMSGAQKMMVIGAGVQSRLLMPFTAEKRRLRDLARGLEATDAPGRVKETILFAHTFLKRDSADRVVVISDGAFDGAEELTKPAAHYRFVSVAGGSENIAIIGFEARLPSDRSAPAEIMVHLRNFTAKAVRVPLAVSLDEKLLAREEIEIGAGERRVMIYPFTGELKGILTARLEAKDDFPTDNVAYLSLTEQAPLRLLYVGPGNPYLQHVLRLFPYVQLSTAPRWDERATPGAEPFDLVIFDRVAAPALEQGNFILINSVSPNLPLDLRGRTQNPRLALPLAKHPLTAGLSLGDLRISEALRFRAPAQGVVLARDGEDHPLLYVLERGKLRLVLLPFDLMASDLPLRIAFPILFHNLLEWFHPERLEFPGEAVKAGDPFTLTLARGDDAVEITSPSRKKESLSTTSSRLLFAETLQTGIYSFKTAGHAGRFAVNLCDEDESQIAPRAQLTSGPGKSVETARESESGAFSLWPALLIAVLLLLALELGLALRQNISLYPVIVRGAALALLALAFFDPRIYRSVMALDVILDIDLSRSVGQQGRETALAVLESAKRLAGADTRTGLLSFGRTPQWEWLPHAGIATSELTSRLDRDETDIQAALQAAAAQVDEGREGKILLISDGNENRGEVSRVIPLLRAQGVEVWTLPVSLARGRNEVYLSDLTLPHQVDSAEGFEIRGAVESTREAPARIRLLRDGVLQAERQVQLRPGSNQVSFRDTLTERGSHAYELLVDSPDDTLAENNLLRGVVTVKGPPRVLLLSGEKSTQRAIAKVLEVQGYTVVQAAPENQSLSLSELSAYDLLVLDNVPAFQLAHAKMESIEKYVRDLGGGLLVIGGSQSYGAGGYFRTPLERVLPVDMRPPARLEMPHVALLFVLDKSGSMGAGGEGSTKLDLAKAAAIAAADIMNPTDQVGILAFDASWDWTLPFRQVGKGDWISDRLASLQSDGGTDLYKAMVEAYRGIAAKPAAIKHVIVLSDGLTDKADFHSLIARMARDGITVSTVSVGSDADVQLMADIAKDGKGRGYVALDPETIPQIFTTETLLISRDLIIEKPVTPTIVAGVGPLKGLAPNNLPAVGGYVLTYPKPRAELLMRVDKDPLLVAWRYGVGRVMAFTSDLTGRWGKDWIAWRNFPQWASQLARDSMRKIVETRTHTDFVPDGDSVKVVADVIGRDGKFMNFLKLTANITTSNQPSQQAALEQTAPGRYEGRFVPAARGVHFVTLYAQAAEAAQPIATLPYVAPYPKEYRELKPNLPLLSRLAEETGGQMLDPEKFSRGLERLYKPTPGKARHGRETWWPLTCAGLFLFLSDLVLRQWPVRKTTA